MAAEAGNGKQRKARMKWWLCAGFLRNEYS